MSKNFWPSFLIGVIGTTLLVVVLIKLGWE
jgi:hypothetical protein